MKILVTGGSGQLGFLLVERLLETNNEVCHTFLTKRTGIKNGYCVNLSNKSAVSELFVKTKPDVVIHSAALTNVDFCEKERNLAYKTNVESTLNILEECKKSNSEIIFISSSFVFDGKKKIFTEDDATCPINYYGYTKKVCEDIIKESGLQFIIARTDQPYGQFQEWQRDDNVKRVINKLRKKETCFEPIDWFNNPTYAVNFVECVIKLIEQHEHGVYHIVGSSFINRFDWAVKIASIFNNDEALVKPIMSSKLNVLAKRPNSNLSNKKATLKTGLKIDDINSGLIKLKEALDCNQEYKEKYFSN
ncbi:MAG: SDR family oxidoreductase [Candidatus Micrarchaeaceae archaeon]